MLIVVVSAVMLMGAALVLVARAVVLPRMRTAETLGQIDAYGFEGAREGEGDAPGAPTTGPIDRLAGRVGGLAGRFGGFREASLRRELVAAGLYSLAPRKFLGYRVLCAISVPAAWLWTASAAGYAGPLAVLGIPCAAVAGWVAPMTIVRRRARRRSDAIDYDLPDLIDVLVVTVEAGLGFNASLQLAGERLKGPLGDELRLTLQEQSMGLSTNEALRNLLARCDTPLMRSFVRSVLQGETLGVSIGQIMRELSTEMRKRRRQAAEERAQKAPIKLLFPLVFLIFPAMFVILLGPAIFSFLEAIGG
ncbi:MAG TPA: type II secretion system F family protein [Gaiellaceae bacterium]|nr:type II secretion system F family protein [Gaiellaceae bacterium]